MNAQPETPDCDVCIVGLGPTGLMMAHLMALRGLRVTVLEREPERYGMARAVYTDDQCLRIMQTAGLVDELHREMRADLPVRWLRKRDSTLAVIHDPRRTYGWPTANFLYQPAFEGRLEDALGRYPQVEVLRGRELVGLEQDADGVTARHQECTGTDYGKSSPRLTEGSRQELRARYLVACDGGRSAVREDFLQISMSGKAFPQRWLVIDLRAKEGAEPFAHLPFFDFHCDPELPVVSCPQPFNRHRFEFMLHDHDATEDFEQPGKALELLADFVDTDSVVLDRQLVYTFKALVADRWRDRRVFLAGDAAHMTPQFVGQGMNAGIRDADNLSWKLAEVIGGHADPVILDSYESERRPHAKAMMNLSVLNKVLVSTGNPVLTTLRDRVLPVTRRTPGAATWLRQSRMKPRPRFRQGTFVGLPRAVHALDGQLFPQPPVRDAHGHAVRFDDAIGPGWSVIGIDVDPRRLLGLSERQDSTTPEPTWVDLLPAGRCAEVGPGVLPLELADSEVSRWLDKHGVMAGSIVVLRPDRFVWGVVIPGDEESFRRTVDFLTTIPPGLRSHPRTPRAVDAQSH